MLNQTPLLIRTICTLKNEKDSNGFKAYFKIMNNFRIFSCKYSIMDFLIIYKARLKSTFALCFPTLSPCLKFPSPLCHSGDGPDSPWNLVAMGIMAMSIGC